MKMLISRFLAVFGCSLIAISLVFLPPGFGKDTTAPKKEALKYIEQESRLLIETSDSIWKFAEIALMESQSADLLMDILAKKNFRVERGVAGMPTAFVATFGDGEPVIGILAEYDALPGLSQDRTPFKKALVERGAGQGCGHNLFAAGSLGAAITVKEVMEKNRLKGTVKLFGCPAEEDVGGKLFMARDGFFNGLDVCLAWHPSQVTRVDVDGSQAIDDLEIEFFGKTAHAAFDPWMGASALDAVEMTTFGINLLREHVKPSVRMHYVVTRGGDVPNVIPDNACLWLWVRDSHRDGVKIVVGKVEKIVEGAALATGTTAQINYKGSFHEMLINMAGSRVMQKNLEMIGPVSYSEEEKAFAQKLQKETRVEEKGLAADITKLEPPAKDPQGGSTDVAEVSWIAPTINLSTTTAPSGIPWHSWAVVASSCHSIGHKGMLLAAKVLATTAIDALLDERIREEIKKEFDQTLKGYKYKSGIPEDRKPPIRKKN